MKNRQLSELEQLIPLAHIYIYHYLSVWFKQIFESNELVEFGPFASWNELFSHDVGIYAAMASQVSDVLLGNELNIEELSPDLRRSFELVSPHAQKWANDAMERDADLREFVIQTLRIEMICKMEESDSTEWLQTSKGKKVFEVLNKHGAMVLETPSSTSYIALFEKWKSWYSIASEKELI